MSSSDRSQARSQTTPIFPPSSSWVWRSLTVVDAMVEDIGRLLVQVETRNLIKEAQSITQALDISQEV